MNTVFLNKTILFMVFLMPVAALGQTVQKPLDDKENPLLIGKRDLNTDHTNFYTLDQELALGRRLAADVDREVGLVNDQLVTEYVDRVGRNIALHSDARMPVTIKIIDTDDVNAFALPGGYLYISRGMLEAADSEAELAWVMAHWIAHVAARHGLEQVSKLNLNLQEFIFPPMALLIFKGGAEEEADRLGAQYMWASGYDQKVLGDFFNKLQLKVASNPNSVPRLFSISRHLMTVDRLAQVNRLVARFPDKPGFAPDSIEFSAIKERLRENQAEKRTADLATTPPVLKHRQR